MRDGLIQTGNVQRGVFGIQELKRQHLAATSNSRRSMLVLEGRTGRGKTLFVEWYVVQDPDALYLEADPDWTPSWLMRDVAQAMGLPRAHSTETNKMAVIKEQQRRETEKRPRLLVIDEADRVVRRTALFDSVRGLHDKARLPIVLVGEAGIWGNIRRKNDRFADRMCQVVEFRDVTATDIGEAALQLCDLKLPAERAAQIQRQADGNFRRAAKVLAELERVLKANPAGEVSKGMIDLAVQNLMLAEARETRRKASNQ